MNPLSHSAARQFSQGGEPLAKPKCFSAMPKPLTLGEVASRSDDGEGEAVSPIKTKIGARRWSSCMSRFCFSFALCAVPITPNAAHRAMGANKNHGSPEKREWNGGIGVCAAMKAPVGLLSHKAVLRKQDGAAPPRQTWRLRRSPCRGSRFSGAT